MLRGAASQRSTTARASFSDAPSAICKPSSLRGLALIHRKRETAWAKLFPFAT
jgi:hypothetical protein